MKFTKSELEMAIDALDAKRTEYYRIYERAYDRDIADTVQRKIDEGKMLYESLCVELERVNRRVSGAVNMRLNAHQIDMLISAMKSRLRKYYRILDEAKRDMEQTKIIQGCIYSTNELITRLLEENEMNRNGKR